MRRLAFTIGLLVSACASTPSVAPPPPPPASGAVLPDWRAVISSPDMDRYRRLDDAWRLALEQARRQPGSGDLRSLGRLLEADAGRPDAAPPPGAYRCRTVKLGSQGGEGGLGYVVYGWFACRIEATPQGLRLTKTTGSQRPAGLLYPETDRRMVFLGALALAAEPASPAYGRRLERNLVGVLERIDDRRWRLALPWPETESNLDLIELVPA